MTVPPSCILVRVAMTWTSGVTGQGEGWRGRESSWLKVQSQALPLIRDRAHEVQECATGYKLIPYGLMDISELHGMSHAGMSQGPYAGMSQGPYWYEPGTMQV